MSRLIRRWLWVCVGLWSAHAQGSAITVRDDQGQLVRMNRPAQRVVSLLPSLTESICVIGACSQLVATDRWSDWPASVQALPKVGGLDDLNIEAIVAARPDLIVVSPASRAAARLRSLGLTVLELDAQSLEDVHRILIILGQFLGRTPGADLAWQQLQEQLKQAQRRVPPQARGVRVYFEVGAGPYAAGPTSYLGQVLSMLGAVNVVPASLGTFPLLSPEWVVRSNPDLIMVGQREVADVRKRPGWSGMRALKQGHVCAIAADVLEVLGRPGPRVGGAALTLAQCLKDTVELK